MPSPPLDRRRPGRTGSNTAAPGIGDVRTAALVVIRSDGDANQPRQKERDVEKATWQRVSSPARRSSYTNTEATWSHFSPISEMVWS